MSLVKYLFELVLATIVIFFVWNILKRLFFNQFYKNFPSLNPKNREKAAPKPQKKSIKENVNWDAETVDYEEVKDENNNNK